MAEAYDYLAIIDKNRSGGVEHAATTPVFYEKPTRRRLTKARRRAKLLKSASGRKGKAKSGERKTSSRTRKTPQMATKKQKAAARRNIKKAQAAKRAKAAARSRAGKKAARTRKAKHSRKAARKATKRTARKARKSSKRSRAAKKAARTRKANKAARKAARKSSRKSRKSSRRPKHSRKSRKGGRRKTRRSMSMRVPRKTKKVYVVAAEKSRRRRARHGGGRRRGAMENPMTGVEIFVGSITGLAGFGLADFVDRMLATHALTDKNAKDANGQELYADNPPADGNYVGLFNPTAICAPMDWKRWVFGLLGAAVPLGAAQLVSGPTARSALQFFGFGYGVRVVGKGVIDGLALLTKSTGMGQRLYDGEMRAAVLKANNGNNQANELASLPAAGLGQVKQLAGTPCKDCGDKQQTGAGYPSMPREVAPNAQPTSNATPPAPPPAPATPPSQFNPGPLTGVPNGKSTRKNPYLWGEPIN